jgi:hypothetical protein
MSYVCVALACASLTACGPSSAEPAPSRPPAQSYRDALDLWCNVDQRAGLAALEDPLEKSQRRSDWLTEHVKNPDAIYLKTLLAVKSQSEQAHELRSEAKTAGLTRCPFADSLEQEPL